MPRHLRLLVTGASGFLGREVVRDLINDGHVVRRALRTQDQLGGIVVGEIDGRTDWSKALADIDGVVHLAALAHRDIRFQTENVERYRAVNVDGTRNLAQQAMDRGIQHFVFCSSIGVHGLTTEGRPPFSESSPLCPISPYAQTKIEAEAALSDLSTEHFAVAALRMPLIYGSSAPGNLKMVLRAIERGLPLPLASVQNKRAFAAPKLFSSFVSSWIDQPTVGFEPYIIAHEEQVSTADFVRELGGALGRTARLFPFPPYVLSQALKAIGRDDTAHGLFSSLEVRIDKALSTGWRPPHNLSEGLHKALART